MSRYADEDRLSRVSLRSCPYAILFHGVVKKDTEGTKGTNLVVHDFDCGEEQFFVVVDCRCKLLFPLRCLASSATHSVSPAQRAGSNGKQ